MPNEVGASTIVVKNLHAKHRGRQEPTIRGVSFDLQAGETLGIVGESGCGKSTLLRSLIGLVPIASGEVSILGQPLPSDVRRSGHNLHLGVQMVYQDPFASLNPRMTVRQILEAPLKVNYLDYSKSAVHRLLGMVGLSESTLESRPAQLSGGQRQRMAIARALSIEPRVLLLDEPTSALDVSIQAQVVNLIADLQQEKNFSCVFVSHDLSVLSHIAHRMAVMYLGEFVEMGNADRVLARPLHPYTEAMTSSVPTLRSSREMSRAPMQSIGEMNRKHASTGCRFAPRCWRATNECLTNTPNLEPKINGHLVSCHHPT